MKIKQKIPQTCKKGKIMIVRILILILIALPLISEEEGGCARCKIIREEVSKTHKNYKYYDDYMEDADIHIERMTAVDTAEANEREEEKETK